MAAFGALADLRGPLYAKLCLAVPGSDARKRRGVRAAAARTRRAEIRSAGRQRRRRAVCGGGGVGERRRGLRAPPAGLSYGRKSLPRRHDAPCAYRDRRGHGPCRVAGRHSRAGRICGLCELRIDARKRRRRALYGPPPRRRDLVCRQSDDGRRDVDLPRAFSLSRRTAGGRDPFEPFADGRAHRLGRRGEDRRRLRQRGPHVLRLAAPARRGACRGDQRLPAFLRGCALLASVGGISGRGLYAEKQHRRLQGRLHVARPLGQCPDGRLGASARLRGAAHSGRHGAGVPLRRRGARRRRHHRHAGHLLHP